MQLNKNYKLWDWYDHDDANSYPQFLEVSGPPRVALSDHHLETLTDAEGFDVACKVHTAGAEKVTFEV